MSEIKNELIQLYPGDTYECKGEDYVITEDHSINDILRFLIFQCGHDVDEVKTILKLLDT